MTTFHPSEPSSALFFRGNIHLLGHLGIFAFDVVMQPAFGDLQGAANTGQRKLFQQQAIHDFPRFGRHKDIVRIFEELTSTILAKPILFSVVDVAIFDGIVRLAARTQEHEAPPVFPHHNPS